MKKWGQLWAPISGNTTEFISPLAVSIFISRFHPLLEGLPAYHSLSSLSQGGESTNSMKTYAYTAQFTPKARKANQGKSATTSRIHSTRSPNSPKRALYSNGTVKADTNNHISRTERDNRRKANALLSRPPCSSSNTWILSTPPRGNALWLCAYIAKHEAAPAEA